MPAPWPWDTTAMPPASTAAPAAMATGLKALGAPAVLARMTSEAAPAAAVSAGATAAMVGRVLMPLPAAAAGSELTLP